MSSLKNEAAVGSAVPNIDHRTVAGFGDEWAHFTQARLSGDERARILSAYFRIFPWELLPQDGGCGADIGCGSGRWALLVAPRVAKLHLLDPAGKALEVARANLRGVSNVEFHQAGVSEMPFADGSLDFAYSLGVLHHVPDIQGALRAIAAKLRPRAPFLAYIYYAFDNRPLWYRLLWRASDVARRAVSRLPFAGKVVVSNVMAALVYWPLGRTAALLATLGILPAHWPLAYYHDKSFYLMRTNALDRFGTRLEQRFTRAQIAGMFERAGFADVNFSDEPPYWCVVGIRSQEAR